MQKRARPHHDGELVPLVLQQRLSLAARARADGRTVE